jgi:serine/threonine protein kinase
MVFEVLGQKVLKLITKSNYSGIPLENVRIITKQVLEGLHYLHTKCQIIHTDLKPENVLMSVNESDVKQMADETLSWVKNGINPSTPAGLCIFL